MSVKEEPRCRGRLQLTTKCPDPCPAVPRGKLTESPFEVVGSDQTVNARSGPDMSTAFERRKYFRTGRFLPVPEHTRC